MELCNSKHKKINLEIMLLRRSLQIVFLCTLVWLMIIGRAAAKGGRGVGSRGYGGGGGGSGGGCGFFCDIFSPLGSFIILIIISIAVGGFCCLGICFTIHDALEEKFKREEDEKDKITENDARYQLYLVVYYLY